MKHLFLLIITFGICYSSNGQSIQEKSEIIQKCIDLDLLQKYFTENEKQGDVLVILENGILPENLTLSKFGNPVAFMLNQDIFMRYILSYLVFENFEVNNNQAKVIFTYHISKIKVIVSFDKKDEDWIISKSNIIELK